MAFVLLSMTDVVMGADIEINESNFPDAKFRDSLMDGYGEDGILTEEEIADITDMNISDSEISNLKGIEFFTALTTLDCRSNQLTTLDVSKNTSLTELNCSSNQLTTLDVSKNTSLTKLDCSFNQLTTLNVSKNTALESLDCAFSKLTTLDVSKNTALTELNCSGNQLTRLDVSNNTSLTELLCFSNQLAALDVSKNTALKILACFKNRIQENEMAKLIDSLPTVSKGAYEFARDTDSGEQNVVTKELVAKAKKKGWSKL